MSLKVIFPCKHISAFTVKSFAIHPSSLTYYLELKEGNSMGGLYSRGVKGSQGGAKGSLRGVNIGSQRESGIPDPQLGISIWVYHLSSIGYIVISPFEYIYPQLGI